MWEIDKLAFGAVLEAGFGDGCRGRRSDDTPTSAGVRVASYPADASSLHFWALLSPRFSRDKDKLEVLWIHPDGAIVARAPLASTRRRANSGRDYARAELALPARAGATPTGRWTVEVRLEDDPVTRHSILVGAPEP